LAIGFERAFNRAVDHPPSLGYSLLTGPRHRDQARLPPAVLLHFA
jgi:hypothetical protein